MSQKEKYLTADMYSAYLEMALGVMSLRLTPIQKFLVDRVGEASITSSYPKETIGLRIEKIVADISRQGLVGPKNLRSTFTHLNSVFLISMWSLLIETKTYDQISKDPIIQFFRHVRNACAHSGRFNFTELPRPAKWRDKEITLAQRDLELFPRFLMDGDVVLLTLEVNQTYFDPIEDDRKTG